MHMIDRRRVQASFGKYASQYEAHAVVQKTVIGRLMAILQAESVKPQRCLDVGSGSGLLLRSLRQAYRDAYAVGVDLSPGMNRVAQSKSKEDPKAAILAADAEALPFADGSFDLVVSTSTFQWLDELSLAFNEAYRVLKPGGSFIFSLFGEKTLHELRTSYRAALRCAGDSCYDHTHTFFTRGDTASAVGNAGFSLGPVIVEEEVEMHPNVLELLRSIKRIGAGNASREAYRGPRVRTLMADMMDRYRSEYGNDSGIPATYEIIYGIGRKEVSDYL